MPDRIIRASIVHSYTLAGLSAEAERFWHRLTVVVDDHGRYHADPQLLHAATCPLIKKASVAHVGQWLAELEQADLVRTYTVDTRPYLFVVKWAKYQRIRADTSRYPAPPADICGHPPTSADIRGRKRESEARIENRESRVVVGGGAGGNGAAEDRVARPTKGTRFTLEAVPDEWAAFASGLGLDAAATFAQFGDYWRAKPGQGGVKLDWFATWRNWCRTEVQRHPELADAAARRERNERVKALMALAK